MNENDRLQLFDPEMAEHIRWLEADPTYEFVLTHLETLKSLKRFDSGFMYALKYGMEHFKKCFYRDWEEDERKVTQCLINDLAFLGEPLYLDFWARSAYLDHPTSTAVRSSETFISKPPKYLEAHYYWQLFDLLEAAHVRLMVEGMKKNQKQIDPEKYTDYLKLEMFAAAIEGSPTIKAAYIWDFRDH